MKKIFLYGAFVLMGANAYAYTCCTNSTGHACEAVSADYCCTGCSDCMPLVACKGGITIEPEIGLCINNCPSSWDGMEWTEYYSVLSSIHMYKRTTCETMSVDGLCTNVYATEYSCDEGGYLVLVSTNVETGESTYRCAECPDDGMSAVYNTDITGCYIPENSERSDETGPYVFSGSDCYYSTGLDIEL